MIFSIINQIITKYLVSGVNGFLVPLIHCEVGTFVKLLDYRNWTSITDSSYNTIWINYMQLQSLLSL